MCSGDSIHCSVVGTHSLEGEEEGEIKHKGISRRKKKDEGVELDRVR